MNILFAASFVGGITGFLLYKRMTHEPYPIHEEGDYQTIESKTTIAGTLSMEDSFGYLKDKKPLASGIKNKTTKKPPGDSLYGKHIKNPSFEDFIAFTKFRKRQDVVMRLPGSYKANIAKVFGNRLDTVHPVQGKDWVFTAKGNENKIKAIYFANKFVELYFFISSFFFYFYFFL